MVISMLKIRRPLGRLIFNMGIAIPGKTVFLIETAPSMCQALAAIIQIRGGDSIESTSCEKIISLVEIRKSTTYRK